MMPAFGFRALTTASLLAVFCIQVYAGVSVELEAGLEYDSNVAVDAAESDSGLGDQAQLLQMALGYQQPLGKTLNLSGRYQLSDTRWQRYSDYDTRMHTGVLRMGWQPGRLNSDLALIAAQAEVDDQVFLNLSRVSPAIGWLLNRHWYVRGQADVTRKEFPGFPARNSQGGAFGLHLYRFIDRTRFYLSSSLQWKTEQADDPIYSYDAASVRVQLRRDWTLAGKTLSTRVQGRFEQRRYEEPRTDIGAARADDRWRIGLESSLQLSRRWNLEAGLNSDSFRSNLAAADYDQQRYRLGLVWRW